MKTIDDFNKIDSIIKYKLDVVDDRGCKVPFVRFLNMSLLEIINIIYSRTWKYDNEI